MFSQIYTLFVNRIEELNRAQLLLEVGIPILLLLWMLFRKSGNSSRTKVLDELEIEEKIKSWTPKPMVDPNYHHHHRITTAADAESTTRNVPRVITSKAGGRVTINGRSCVNFATNNYYNFLSDESIENSVVDAVNKYGIGSCGPRAFFGTFDIHTELEEKIANFMEMEEAVIYSYGFSTVTSAIQAYVKSKDVVYVDEEANFAIQKGLQSSKAELVYFKHNCPDDLERLITEANKRTRKKRAFLIVEGIYLKTGNVCDLPKLIDIRIKHKIRIFIDESISFGVLGERGRGITEHFNIPKDEVDLIIGSLETTLSSVGGFCVGSTFVVEHQRLSGLGYCFSASLPPLLSAAAIKALDRIENRPEMLAALKERSVHLHRSIISHGRLTEHFTLGSDEISPLKHLYLSDKSLSHVQRQRTLENIVDYCISEGIAVAMATYLDDQEYKRPEPSIRLLASVVVTDQDVDSLINVLSEAAVRVAKNRKTRTT